MTKTNLPVALEGLLRSLSKTSKITSWNVLGTKYMTTLVIRWDSSDRSAMGHAVSIRTRFKYRKKSPSQDLNIEISVIYI